MDTIRLYTRQNDKTLSMLRRGGRIVNRRVYVEMHFGDMAKLYLDSYDWFAEEASKRVPRPAGVTLPIWCALKGEECLLPVEGTVIYIVDVPRDKVIFFDEAKWDRVLNHCYVPLDEADDAAYLQRLAAMGVQSPFEFFEGRYAGKYPAEMRRVLESRIRVFDVPDQSARTVNANIWEIREEELVRIVRPGETVLAE